jgi:hypothetical protein
MGLYNFQSRFAPYILDGSKTHTIRRDRRDEPGNTCHLYTGLRTKAARCLMRAPCTQVEEIEIRPSGQILIEGEQLSHSEMDLLAWRDGFRPFGATEQSPWGAHRLMMRFWRTTSKGKASWASLPFHGFVIHWQPKRGGR